MEIKYPEKSDNDLAVEMLFGAYGFTEEQRKKGLGGRYEGAKEETPRLLQNNAILLTTIQQYLKKYGFGNLI